MQIIEGISTIFCQFDCTIFLFQKHDTLLESTLLKLFKCSIIDILSQEIVAVYKSDQDACHHNMLTAISILKSSTCYYVIHPHTPFTLNDVLTLSPAVLARSSAKKLFIVYQLLQAMRHCHSLGLALGDVNASDIAIDDKLWLHVLVPQLDRIFLKVANDGMAQEYSSLSNRVAGPETGDLTTKCCFSSVIEKHGQKSLSTLTYEWMSRDISNFEYLVLLNHLSGRRMNDPNQHPVMPWVMDFSSAHWGLRDLTKSKFRLNKGDEQLDLTYSPVATSLPVTQERALTPHHISDVISDITYFVYKARCTPKSLLTSHVRSNWVPHEYPASIQRLQEWTPDECIPEFFTDARIFMSIHADLPDLEVPPWCSTVADFLQKHMAVLESAHVSMELHHWIDLTFGFKVLA